MVAVSFSGWGNPLEALARGSTMTLAIAVFLMRRGTFICQQASENRFKYQPLVRIGPGRLRNERASGS